MDKKILGKVQSVDKALNIMKLLAEKGQDMKLTEIAEELDINKSTLHGLMSTLRFHGFVDQDDDTQKYKLGIYLIQLGELAAKSLDIIKLTSPTIDQVSKRLEETVHIGQLDGRDVIYVNKKESEQSMRIYTTIGTRNLAHCTGVGKAIMAFKVDENFINSIPDKLEAITAKTITSKKKLLKDFEQIRERGYAFDDEENNVGLTCVAAPIFDHSGKVRYGISVSGPTIRMTDGKIQETIKVVKEAALEISRKLGYKN